jgi:hypothetical protein
MRCFYTATYSQVKPSSGRVVWIRRAFLAKSLITSVLVLEVNVLEVSHVSFRVQPSLPFALRFREALLPNKVGTLFILPDVCRKALAPTPSCQREWETLQ